MESKFNIPVGQIEYSQKRFSPVTELGFALMLIGIQFGTAIRNVFPGLELVNIIMLLSFLFIVDFKNIIRFKLPSANKYFLVLFLFNFVSFIYLIVSPSEKYPELNSQIFFMQLYIFAILFALSTQSKNKNLKNLDRYLFYISAFINIVILYQVTLGFKGIYLENIFFDSSTDSNHMDQGGDKITMGRALFLSFVTALVYKSRNKVEFIIKPVIVMSALLGLYMFNTRSSIVLCIISMAIYFWYQKGTLQSKKNILRQSLFYGGIALILFFAIIYLYQTNSLFQALLDKIGENIYNGIVSYFTNQSTDESAATRRDSLIFFINNTFQIDFSYLVFGHGFISYFFDFPLLQAFYDLGIFFFLFYIISLICFPVKFIFYKKTYIPHIIIIQLMAFHYLIDQLYCGVPYWSFQFMPIILLTFFYVNNKSSYRIK